MFQKCKIEMITPEEMNKHLEYCRDYRHIEFRNKNQSDTLGNNNAFLSDKMTRVELLYRKGKKDTVKYICSKNEDDLTNETYALESWRNLNKYYKVPLMDMNELGGFSASPYLWYNPKYENMRQEAWSYDINSAYAAAMLKDMPDTSKEYRTGYVEEGEIGFRVVPKFNDDGDMAIATTKVGTYCTYIFPLMKSPFVRFANRWYEEKKNGDKAKAKAILVCAVGYLQNKNPFLRAAILTYANDYIRSFVDENTLMVNTDCVVSRVRRPDIEELMGPELGQFKNDHHGMYAYRGFTAQWDLEVPVWRGVPKIWFKEGFDILKDKRPIENNLWSLDKENLQLVRNF